jgi:hypothetical protein
MADNTNERLGNYDVSRRSVLMGLSQGPLANLCEHENKPLWARRE